jgi:hypothetical protein
MTQNKLIDYSIGKYSSLMPQTKHASAAGITKTLNLFEKHKNNHLMCIAYSGDFKDPKKPKNLKVEGAYVFDHAKEGDAFFKMANSKTLLGTFQKENAWPTQANVRAYLQKNGSSARRGRDGGVARDRQGAIDRPVRTPKEPSGRPVGAQHRCRVLAAGTRAPARAGRCGPAAGRDIAAATDAEPDGGQQQDTERAQRRRLKHRILLTSRVYRSRGQFW